MDYNKLDRYNQKAINYYEQGNYNKALKYLDRLISMLPNEPIYLNAKGNCHFALYQHQEALNSFDKALSLNPMDPVIWVNKGNTLLNLGKFQGALTCYNRAIELNPGEALPLNQKGVCLENLGKFQEALECYDQALELNPFDEVIIQNKQNVMNALGHEGKSGGNFNNKTAFSDVPNIKSLERNNDIEGLIDALNNVDVYIRRRAVKALGRLKDKKAIPAIKNAIENDKDHLVKKHALKALDDLKIECPECKFNNGVEAIFCQECGYDLRKFEESENKPSKIEEIDTKCSNCGFENVENAKFCSGCGNKLESNISENIPNFIDINSTSEDKIASLPGIGPILAKKAIKIRESKGGFDSVDDFCSSLELKPHVAKNLESSIICNPIRKPKEPGSSRRIVDF